MAVRTPQKEESAEDGKLMDKEWVTEHARQVGKNSKDSDSVLKFNIYCLIGKINLFITTKTDEGL